MSTTAASAVRAETPVAALVARAGTGDRDAEADLCRRFEGAVRLFARRRLRKPEAVDEFAQDVMLVLIEALRDGAVDDPARLGGFVLGICRNLASDRVRQKERREALWQRYGSALAPPVSEPAADPGDLVGYDVIHLEDCLTQLPQRSRDVVRLAYADALSADEIAAQLGTSAVNARVLRHRALQALRTCMGKRISWEALG
jgi:RNA polymerase sigma-70 factor (ECF subfamily)